ncbi:hypothetical protein KRP46_24315, partial [Salmonella enterica subsp. enterica serovar Indiana]|nr:hypothetical protein [Salmonella enterica subsp. enterica serovar Indiana]
FIVGGPVGDFELLLCHGTVCVVGKIRDLILQLSKSSIYSTKPTPYLMVLLLNNDVWCKSREVVALRNLIEQAWGKVLGEDNSITHLVVYPEVLSLVFDAANTYNAEPGVLEQTAQAYIESHGAIERHLGCSDF